MTDIKLPPSRSPAMEDKVEQRAWELLEAECGKPLPFDVPTHAALSALRAALAQQPAAPSDEHLIETGCYQTVIDRHSQPATSAEPPYEIDALFDALSNLEHDNYERSYSGSKNREADAGLIRAALERYAALAAQQQGGAE